MKHFKLLLFAAIVLIDSNVSAQTITTSPFKHLPNPNNVRKLAINSVGVAAAQTLTAWRFTAAAAGYDFINKKLLTGAGYGFNSMHVNTDANGNATWYTDFTANICAYAAGNIPPVFDGQSSNVIAFGPSIGFFNKAINIGYVFYPPMNGSKSQSGAILNFALPLN